MDKSHEQQELLRASEARFRRIMESNMIGIFFWEASGTITEANKAFLQMVGYTAGDVAAGRLRWPDMVPGEYDDRVRHALEELQSRGVCTSYEKEYVRQDGARVPVLFGGASLDDDPSRGVAFVLDIGRRKQAENRLAASEGRFRAFMDNSPAVAFIKDADGRRVYFNRHYQRIFRSGADDLLGKTDFDLYPREVAEKLHQTDAAILQSRTALQTVEDVPTPDGVTHHWLVFKFPIEETPGQWFVGGVAVDITEQKEKEEELRRARDELELRVSQRTANLVASNTRLQQEIAQREQVEAALRRDREFLQHLLSMSESDRKLVAYEIHDGLVQYVTAALMHLDSFVPILPPDVPRENLDVSRSLLRDALAEARRLIGGLRPPILDEAGIVAAIEYLIGEQIDGCRIQFIHDVHSDRFPPLIESALFRICQEALTNIRKHSKASNAVVELIEATGLVRLSISDDGIGFQPPGTTGHTFGLQGIRERARLLGGQATVESTPGAGTRVQVELPLESELGTRPTRR
jgi:PAS domain S-box-containing protein